MTSKIVSFLCLALFSVSFALPSPQPEVGKPMEAMKPAETVYTYARSPYVYNTGYHPVVSPLRTSLDWGYPYYSGLNPYNGISPWI